MGSTVRIEFAPDVSDSRRARVLDAWTGALASTEMPDAIVRVDAHGRIDSLLEQLSVRVTLAALEHQRGRMIMMHAAGVALDDGRVVAFVGPSGRGKTTLSSALGAHFGYVSDETVAVDLDLEVRAYRKPLSLVRSDGPKEQVSPVRAGLMDLPDAPLRLAALVLLDRRSGVTEPVASRVPVIDAIAELVPQLSFMNDFDAPLQRLAGLCDAVGGVWRLSYGEAATLVPLVPELVRAPPGIRGAWRPVVPTRARPTSAPAPFEWAAISDAIAAEESVAVMNDGVYRVLAGIAPSIWLGIGSGLSVEQLVERAIEDFGPPPHGDASELVAAAIDELVGEGLVVRGTAQ
ncbi:MULTISPECIES: hypothetical protein [unclassified Agromyces]|uniref:hypothetical protein n=1 Tax=unclassified Agromyces TaxID=2639701 RepID=UPI00301579FE